ncbi:cytochrome P450 [Thelephora ganbajun]|uniref:Cytochrome P450 n=1 Tax=Thelephora ganbajun TaxID=370292 RepID=A0ACB6Z3T4_THEGA|nr:cytochrome P450 [Thelephora ganbajun]
MNQPLNHVQGQALAVLKVVATNSPSLLKVLKWLLVLVSLTGTAVLRRLLVIWFKAWRSPLRALPGPKSKSWFLGNFDLRFDPENALPHEQWISEYGTTFSYAGLLNKPRIMTVDVRALNYILKHGENYQKPEPLRYHLSKILGEGLLLVEGRKHKQQRRVMNPAFTPAHIRSLSPIFLQKSTELCDVLLRLCSSTQSTRVDALEWVSCATLDITGLAGFGYHFNSMTSSSDELNVAFQTIFRGALKPTIMAMLQSFISPLRVIKMQRDKKFADARTVMKRIGARLVQERKLALSEGTSEDDVEKDREYGKDLLSLLVKANMTDPEGSSMSDEDVQDQIATFIVAGHETSSAGIAWCLHCLSSNVEAQERLRGEIFHLGTNSPDVEQIKSLKYLDYVVREGLRLYPPIPSTSRVAMKDDIIPLSNGTGIRCVRKTWPDFNSLITYSMGSIRIAEGDGVFIPIFTLNTDKRVWGKDAQEFKPERWENVPTGAQALPGVWGNIMSFLGGSRACIGYHFATLEIKYIIFALIRNFEIAPALPAHMIQRKSGVVLRPCVKGEDDGRPQMPLLIQPVVLPPVLPPVCP